MATQSLDRRFPSFREYIERQERGEDGPPPYAHPIDQWIIRSLNAPPVKAVLARAIDTIISLQLGQLLAQGISIDQKSFPDLYDVLAHCSETLDITVPHAVAMYSPWLFNAFTAGTDEYSFIFVTAGLCKHYTREEASFVIGHECGHIASEHVVYHTLVWVLTDLAAQHLGPLGRVIDMTAGIPLRAWSRRSEITSDRAGLLCCGDLGVAERALLRLVAGEADVDEVDIDDYLRKYKEVQELHGVSGWQQLLYTHPMIPKRIEALRLFARSELYYSLTGKTPPEGMTLLSREELDRRTNLIVKP